MLLGGQVLGHYIPKQPMSQLHGSPHLPQEGPAVGMAVLWLRAPLRDRAKAGQHLGNAWLGCGPCSFPAVRPRPRPNLYEP